MSTNQGPGLPKQATVRTTARIAAIVLLVVAVAFGGIGLSQFSQAWDSPESSGFGPILWLGGAGFALVAAVAAANAGWMRTGARYTAGETMPVVKDAAEYLSDGKGVGNIGRTEPAPTAGPFCSQCGARREPGDKFCSTCGKPLG